LTRFSRTLISTRAWWWKRFLLRMILTATMSPVLWSRHSRTWPNEPLPRTPTTSYRNWMWSCRTRR